jgi:hypothetical protein
LYRLLVKEKPAQKLQMLELIKTGKVFWSMKRNKYWVKLDNLFYEQILLILLISKNRNKFPKLQVFVKGIALRIVERLGDICFSNKN